MKRRSFKKGFTLVELLTVIAIIGILAGILIPTISTVLDKVNQQASGADAASLAKVIRFANRVPLLYQQSACSITKAVIQTNWRGYGMQQPRGGLPVGPMVVFVHMASVWVPFTSESKEAIAHYDEIIKELKLALQECGRKLGTHIRKGKKLAGEFKKRN